MSIITETSSDNGVTWRLSKNSNFSDLNTRLVAEEWKIDQMFSVLEDASTTNKGMTKVSVAPVSAASPISLGDNDTRLPTQVENDALSGTTGTPSSSNKFVTETDPEIVSNLKNVGAQSVAGTKTFSSIPICSGTPTDANHAVNKAYMDALFANF